MRQFVSIGDIAGKLTKAGFSVGWVSTLDEYGRTVWIIDGHRDGKRFVVRADEKLTAFVEVETAICGALAIASFGHQ